jgi:hypothetical protein
MTLDSILDLDDSARVIWVDSYSTNVFWVDFEDASGRRATVGIDLRKDSPTRNCLFEKARHPNKPGAVVLELGGEEEGIAIPLISRWLDSDEPRKMGYREEGLQHVKNAFLRLGEPIVAAEQSISPPAKEKSRQK